ncbi:hypothetical protein Micbo1qcDRAFT_51129 [Microdochium bolleyi]|uniref:Uncharacterized protein n=1 Tax=Microdochium bolleyi TaxID=196109 RepID=A0A136J6L1_9PEZI|nr:hypothetical protein Micbo1qcDRAFT_51129 [Microdochium bolleyi]
MLNLPNAARPLHPITSVICSQHIVTAECTHPFKVATFPPHSYYTAPPVRITVSNAMSTSSPPYSSLCEISPAGHLSRKPYPRQLPRAPSADLAFLFFPATPHPPSCCCVVSVG